VTVSQAPSNAERTAAWILAGVLVIFGIPVLMALVTKPHEFISYLGFAPNRAGAALAWLLAAFVTIYYVWGAARIPAVREQMFRPTALKALAVMAAVMAGVFEEVVFRKWIMDYLDKHGLGMTLQVLASGLAFGLAHAMWGLVGRSFDAALHAMVTTGILGAVLGVVYLAADRSLAPCIVAHFIMTALTEPGLMVGGLRGQLGLRARPR
jgi:CAAX protease family protein